VLKCYVNVAVKKDIYAELTWTFLLVFLPTNWSLNPVCCRQSLVCCWYKIWHYKQVTKQVTRLVVTEVWSKSFGLVTQCRHDILALYAITHIFAYWTSPVAVTHNTFFNVECGIVRFLCTMHLFDIFGHHPHPLGCLCVKFRFCRTLRCWASPWRKIVYLITQSLIHPAYWIRRERKLLFRNKLSCQK